MQQENRRRHQLTINSTGGPVEYRHQLSGYVHPGVPHVQILVKSADDQWYVQQDAKVTKNGRWCAEVVFGFPESRHGFTVVAIGARKKKKIVDPTPLAAPPANAEFMSAPHTVVRT